MLWSLWLAIEDWLSKISLGAVLPLWCDGVLPPLLLLGVVFFMVWFALLGVLLGWNCNYRFLGWALGYLPRNMPGSAGLNWESSSTSTILGWEAWNLVWEPRLAYELRLGFLPGAGDGVFIGTLSDGTSSAGLRLPGAGDGVWRGMLMGGLSAMGRSLEYPSWRG